jgi:hypothetical protein
MIHLLYTVVGCIVQPKLIFLPSLITLFNLEWISYVKDGDDFLIRFLANAPNLCSNLWLLGEYLLNQLSALVNKVNKKHQQSSTTVRCQLAITEFGGSKCWSLWYLGCMVKSHKMFFWRPVDLNIKPRKILYGGTVTLICWLWMIEIEC